VYNAPGNTIIGNISQKIYNNAITIFLSFHCHHGMARPQVTDGGDSLQIWRVAANTMNKE
jgi:hypothetical protein